MLWGFRWILEEKLAGSGGLGLMHSIDRDMSFIKSTGIRLIVTLTEERLETSPERYGLKGIHFPIADMGVPELIAAETLCHQVVTAIEGGNPCLFHCRAGLGRTGMMIVCTLVSMGHTAEKALSFVRTIHSGYVQSAAQLDFVQNYAKYVHTQGRITL